MTNKKNREIDPEDIFMDSSNLPQFDTHQFEGRLDKPISKVSLIILLGFFVFIAWVYVARAWQLQVKNGETYALLSEENRLRHTPLFAPRGVIYDRNGIEIAWNTPGGDETSVPLRAYREEEGLSHIVGYIQYPSKDSAGFYYQEDFLGMDGAEKYFNDILQGKNGLNLIEVNAQGTVQSGNVIKPAEEGQNISLSIDSRLQSQFFKSIKGISERVGFLGGAGVMMDVNTGEIIAMTSYPEYSSEVMSSKKDVEKVRAYLNDKNKPFLDRSINGLYTPGSIVKPYIALGALNEKIIDPLKKIESKGSISIPNEYDPKLETIFRDWKILGWVDMRHAIAMSSDVYFYTIGGGYKDQKGLGISNIEKYMKMFGFGQKIEKSFFTGADGTIPSPEWKKAVFDGETWRLGNTYHTAIGQYGFQTSPIQIVRAVSAMATKGIMRDPTILKGEIGNVIGQIDIEESKFNIVHEGMRLAVTEGTSQALSVPYVEIAAKSGTAELGVEKANVNSWITGFFPYKNPKYAFAIVLEKGSVHNLIGAAAAMREILDWMNLNAPEYFK